MVFDCLVRFIECACREQFVPILPTELCPSELLGMVVTQKPLTRAKIRHPRDSPVDQRGTYCAPSRCISARLSPGQKARFDPQTCADPSKIISCTAEVRCPRRAQIGFCHTAFVQSQLNQDINQPYGFWRKARYKQADVFQQQLCDVRIRLRPSCSC